MKGQLHRAPPPSFRPKKSPSSKRTRRNPEGLSSRGRQQPAVAIQSAGLLRHCVPRNDKAAREIPLPSARRSDPPGLPLPTDPRTRPVWRRSFARPQPPFTDFQASLCHNAAEAVVNEVQAVTHERRFSRQRWIDWLCRRTEAYYRTSRGLRERFSGPHDREWFRVYQRHWLHTALLRTNFKYRRLLPPEMWGGHSPLACPPTFGTAPRCGNGRVT